MNPSPPPSLRPVAHLTWSLLAVASFHTAHISGFGWLLLPCACALIQLSYASTPRLVFYPLLGVGFAFYAPQLSFFWGLFGPPAILLWFVLAFWIGLFGLIIRRVRMRFGYAWMLLMAPFAWTGLEYFRSELYYLRFSWLTFGMAHHANPGLIGTPGLFSLGFITFGLGAALVALGRDRPRLAGGLGLAITALMTGAGQLPRPLNGAPQTALAVAGVQLEFPDDRQILAALDRVRVAFPEAQLLMLSEYTFQTPPPRAIRDWCATNRVHLVVGGKEPLGETNFHNMAYVIGTDGTIVHQQGKSVPIQFFADGLPAPDRKVWDSPWGKIGILTCYDLSYTRVVDHFVRQGAIALLNPTMDVMEWGEHQHRLHARVAPLRAAEYSIPIFRVASSGISQLVDATGRVRASAAYAGEEEILGGILPLGANRPALPLDRWLAPVSLGLAALTLLLTLIPRHKTTALPPAASTPASRGTWPNINPA